MWCGKGLIAAASLAQDRSARQEKVRLSRQVKVGLLCDFSVPLSLLVNTYFLTCPLVLDTSLTKMDAPSAVHTAVSLPHYRGKVTSRGFLKGWKLLSTASSSSVVVFVRGAGDCPWLRRAASRS
jgi:hypothetical protein